MKSSIIIKFIIYFSISIALILIAGYQVRSQYKSMIQSFTMGTLDSRFNEKPLRMRKIFPGNIENEPEKIKINIAYNDKRNADGTIPVKHTTMDTFVEGIFPTAILISLIIASPIKIKKKILLTGMALIAYTLIVYLKLLLFMYDNYSHPEFALTQLDGFMNFIVYHGNKFYRATGFSTNLIIPVILWILTLLITGDIYKLIDPDK